MDGQKNARPAIIKRKKVIKGGGHHGGAWKVAYADFVTAMMAFFMLMWLLNATTEKQRKGLADYFSPTIPVNRISGGGDGAFGGDSVMSQKAHTQNGTGAQGVRTRVAEADGGRMNDQDTVEEDRLQAQLDAIERQLSALRGESMTMQRALRHVVTKVTDEGLVIEIFDLEDAPLFDGPTARPQPVTRDIAALLAEVLAITTNGLAVNGHVRTFPITLIDNPAWDLSAARAQGFRELLTQAGIDGDRMRRISGHADRKPVTANAMAIRNNRLEIVLLRRDR
ncbi:flagellar motor protein MotB [Szabonella alba]|uniref:Chemotaxis protein MotB n=1 Tax=Szabonella alba TaxID=2804194 RepID=A0A8K0XZE6_9RHOB|nr:flagellar motor protein MotB [Szabonella alba]MBL4917040.1 chemotaxis protein MotB [Szabonella alba]